MTGLRQRGVIAIVTHITHGQRLSVCRRPCCCCCVGVQALRLVRVVRSAPTPLTTLEQELFSCFCKLSQLLLRQSEAFFATFAWRPVCHAACSSTHVGCAQQPGNWIDSTRVLELTEKMKTISGGDALPNKQPTKGPKTLSALEIAANLSKGVG